MHVDLSEEDQVCKKDIRLEGNLCRAFVQQHLAGECGSTLSEGLAADRANEHGLSVGLAQGSAGKELVFLLGPGAQADTCHRQLWKISASAE